MSKDPKKIKKIFRDRRVEDEKEKGRPHSSSWDGKPKPKKNRRKSKRLLDQYLKGEIDEEDID